VFCIKQLRKKNRILYAAKYLKATREAAKREVEILVKLRRCNQVVTFIEVFQCQFYTILVTEYLPGMNYSVEEDKLRLLIDKGGDLFERLSAPDYHLTEEKCQLFIRQIVQGMDFIHTTNIIHLDVKPFNILFANKVGLATTTGQPKVCNAL
jgi:serine/threonine protein kinase